jgi:hypothetical protein
MPRKKVVTEQTIKKTTKKNIIDSMIKENDSNDVIIQIPISQIKINSIINNDKNEDKIVEEPTPYENNCYFINDVSDISCDNEFYFDKNQYNPTHNKNNSHCHWCCHPIVGNVYGLPYNYDTLNDTYYIIGSFCSFQCVNAYNFSINSGSDKVWEINSWIQMIANRSGIKEIIRPAPSRYLLKMFGGNLTIEEFRNAHLNNDKTFMLNIPPMIAINSTSEILNTSYLNKISRK